MLGGRASSSIAKRATKTREKCRQPPEPDTAPTSDERSEDLPAGLRNPSECVGCGNDITAPRVQAITRPHPVAVSHEQRSNSSTFVAAFAVMDDHTQWGLYDNETTTKGTERELPVSTAPVAAPGSHARLEPTERVKAVAAHRHVRAYSALVCRKCSPADAADRRGLEGGNEVPRRVVGWCDHGAVHDRRVRGLVERLFDTGQPVGAWNTIVVREQEKRGSRVFDGEVLGAFLARRRLVEIPHARIVKRLDAILRAFAIALVDDDELDIVPW